MILASFIFKALSFIWHVATESWNVVSSLSHPHHIKLIVIVSNKQCYFFAHISLMVAFLSFSLPPPSFFPMWTHSEKATPEVHNWVWRCLLRCYLSSAVLPFYFFLSFFHSWFPSFTSFFFFPSHVSFSDTQARITFLISFFLACLLF